MDQPKLELISNYYCIACKKCVPAAEVIVMRHIDCGGVVEWRRFKVATMETEPVDD